MAGKREPAGQPPVEDDAQGPDVGAAVEAVRLPPDLLGRHVRRSPRDLAPPQPLDLLVDGQAEVADARLAPQVEQDVRGLQVAVHQAGSVGVGVVHGSATRATIRIRRGTGTGPARNSSSRVLPSRPSMYSSTM